MNTKQLRRKILDLAIRGKLVPQDPADEPASILLERVRAEKESLVKEGKIKRSRKDNAIIRGDDKLRYEQLPQGWAMAQLGSVVNEIATGPFGTMLHKSDYVFDGIPMVNPQHIIDGQIVPSEKITVNQDTATRLNSYRLNTNDIIIGRRGEMGRCAVVTDSQRGWLCGTGCFVLRSNSNINSNYLAMMIRSEQIVVFLSANSIGATMNNLNHSILNQVVFSLPPLAEQHRIVAAIESAFTVIDEIERNKTDLQNAVAAAKQKILSLAIRGKLVPQDPTDEPASVLLERIRAERETLIKAGKIKRDKKDFIVFRNDDKSHYEQLPSGWAWSQLIELYNFIDYRGVTPQKIKSGIPLVTAKNVKGGFIDYSIDEYISYESFEERKGRGVSQKGDILFTTEAPLGNVAIADLDEYSAGQRLITFQNYSKNAQLNNRLFMFFLLSDFFKDQLKEKQTGTTVFGIKAEKLKQLILPIPPLAEQRRIVAAIEAAFEQLNIIIENLV